MSLSRRTILRGAGAALALPFLEAMMPRALASSATLGLRAERPTSLAFLYVPNGIHMADWRPKKHGKAFEMPWTLEPLESYRSSLSILTGFVSDKARANGDGPGDHARAAATFLTGIQPNKKRVEVDISIDQAIANEIGSKTRLRSLTMGVERGAQSGNCDSGYPCSYSSNMSWTSKTTPSLKEVDPQRIFDSLFRDPLLVGGKPARDRRQSVLDLVRAESKALAKKLSSEDRARMEEYASGIRSLEKRLQAGRDEESAAPKGLDRPERKTKRTYEERLALMLELLGLALITDATRVITFMFANEGSNRSYRNLEVPEGHHSLSHHGKDAKKHDQIRRINRFHVEHLARLVETLQQAEEKDGSVLDRTRLLYGSGISDGDRHNHDDLPLLLIGGKGAGHVLLPKPRPVCDLYRGLARQAGAPLAGFGDSIGEYSPPA